MKSKLKKILKGIIDNIKLNYKEYLIYILVLSLLFIRFDYYVFSPGGLINLGDRIEIKEGYPSKGSFNMTYVSAKNATVPVILLSYILPSWDLVSIDESRIEDESSSDIIERNKIYLKSTSYDAVIASFKEAGLPYDITSIDLTVTYIYESSDTNMEAGDIIKNVNGSMVTDYDSITEILKSYKSGDKVNINVERNNKIIECYAVLQTKDDRVVIGIYLSEIKTVKTTPEVEFIFKESESGSSRGLMCALEIYDKITEYDLTNGDIISGTGTIDEKGVVSAVDGIKYKLSGAVRKHAKVFIVPTDNYEEAVKIKKEKNYNIEIIEADNLHNVINKLKNR